MTPITRQPPRSVPGEEGLSNAGNDSVTLMVFPGAGHGIRLREGHTGPDRPPFADGYHEAMLGWLWQHVVEGED